MKNDRYSGKIKIRIFGKVQEYFKIYRDNKQELDHRIIDNNRWYKSRYNSDPDAVIPEPTTPYLFNVIANNMPMLWITILTKYFGKKRGGYSGC